MPGDGERRGLRRRPAAAESSLHSWACMSLGGGIDEAKTASQECSACKAPRPHCGFRGRYVGTTHRVSLLWHWRLLRRLKRNIACWAQNRCCNAELLLEYPRCLGAKCVMLSRALLSTRSRRNMGKRRPCAGSIVCNMENCTGQRRPLNYCCATRLPGASRGRAPLIC